MKPDNTRYIRNIAVDEIGEAGQKKLSGAKVLICGAGGLGSTVIANMASLGVGHIGLVDDDVLELSNLNRQYIHTLASIGKEKVSSAKEWIENYNKDIEVKTYKIRLNEENYKDIVQEYDIIADCFDSFASKFLLNDIAIKTGKLLVHAGVTGFCGQAVTIIPKKSACLECLFPDADLSCYIPKGVVSPAVSMLASVQSMEILKLILGIGEPLVNKMFVYDGLRQSFKVLKVSKNANCKCSK